MILHNFLRKNSCEISCPNLMATAGGWCIQIADVCPI